MPQPKRVSDQEIIDAFQKFGSATKVAEHVGLTERRIYARRMAIEKEHDIELISFNARQIGVRDTYIPHNKRIVHYDIEDGLVFIASDAHYWPGEATIAHQAFIKLLKKFKPKAIIMNGDVFDGATTSRHDPIYKYQTPTAAQEIEACRERLGEIERAAHNARLFWTIGNHDTRLFRFIQANAEAVSCVPGTDIFDYFPGWITCWRLDINKSTVVKHRWHGGIHATHNNAMKSMLPLEQGSAAFVTGHLHKLCVTPFRGIAGTVWGVDSGTLAEPKGEQFAYLEENPVNWASGFVVLTFKGGKLTPPEICEVVNGHAYFRGERIL